MTACVAHATVVPRSSSAGAKRAVARRSASAVHGAFRGGAFRSPAGHVVTGGQGARRSGREAPRATSENSESPATAGGVEKTQDHDVHVDAKPAVVFSDAVESIVRNGLQSALPAVDERLSR